MSTALGLGGAGDAGWTLSTGKRQSLRQGQPCACLPSWPIRCPMPSARGASRTTQSLADLPSAAQNACCQAAISILGFSHRLLLPVSYVCTPPPPPPPTAGSPVMRASSQTKCPPAVCPLGFSYPYFRRGNSFARQPMESASVRLAQTPEEGGGYGPCDLASGILSGTSPDLAT